MAGVLGGLMQVMAAIVQPGVQVLYSLILAANSFLDNLIALALSFGPVSFISFLFFVGLLVFLGGKYMISTGKGLLFLVILAIYLILFTVSRLI